jgi:hypothetical protein
MDTNSQTKGMFKKWTDEVVKTYLSLFIRLAVLSIAGIIIRSVDWSAPVYQDSDLQSIWGALTPFARLFFFFGILTFMKTAPKMFEEIFGYKGKTKEESFGQNLVKGLFGAASAGTVAAIAGGISSHKNKLGFGIGALHGGLSGVTGGWKGGYSGKVGEYGKALIGGSAAAGKALGYKAGTDLIKEKLKYGAEAKSRGQIFDTFRNGAEASYNRVDENGKTGAQRTADLIKKLYDDEGIKDFNSDDAIMLTKAKMKQAGYQNAIQGEGGRLAGDLAYRNTYKKFIAKKARDAERMVMAATTPGEKAAASAYAKKMADASDLAIKNADDAEKSLKAWFEKPQNAHDKMIYENIERADSLGEKFNMDKATVTWSDKKEAIFEPQPDGTKKGIPGEWEITVKGLKLDVDPNRPELISKETTSTINVNTSTSQGSTSGGSSGGRRYYTSSGPGAAAMNLDDDEIESLSDPNSGWERAAAEARKNGERANGNDGSNNRSTPNVENTTSINEETMVQDGVTYVKRNGIWVPKDYNNNNQ